MTSLRKLGLRGVRSYAQTDEESIEFMKPLTIIVGANGAGKTSIIESLKFVTTGSLPPLSDGGKSFVHDPKMDGTNLVKAQVKLSFTTADQKNVLAIRNFQLTQKKAKREFKGMEAVLQCKDADGRESSVSHKCADMEKLVPQLMGVSPAVLENVIFCHQEESLWPLSDGKTLKTKFDDIFAATRYTKALENIAKLRKEKAAEIKVMEAELTGLESSLEQAHKVEDDLANAKASIQKKTTESDRIGEEIKVIEQKLAKLGVKQEELKQIQDLIAGLQAQKDVMIAEKTKANQRMVTDYSDTDEELKGIYANFRATQVNLLKAIETNQTKLKQLEQECVRSEAQMGKLSEDLGKLQAQEADYRRKKQELLELSNRLGSGEASNSHTSLLARLESSFKNKQQEMADEKVRIKKLDQKWEEEISTIKKEESSITEQARIKQAQMDECRAKRGKLVKDMAALDSSSRQLQTIQDQLKASQTQFDALTRTHDPDTQAMKSQIDSKMRSIQSNTQKLSVLSAQRKALASQAESLAQIKLKRSQIQNLLGQYVTGVEQLRRELEEQKLLDSSFPKPLPAFERFKDAFADSSAEVNRATEEYQFDRVEQSLKRRLATLKADTKTKSDHVTSAAAQVSSLQSQRKSAEDQLQSIKKQLAAYRHDFINADVESLFSGTQALLEEEIARADKVFEKASNEQMLGSSAKLMYKRFLGIARDSHKCYLCNRDFADVNEENQFIASNTDKMEKLMSAEKSERSKIATKAAKSKLEQLQTLMPIFAQVQQLQTVEVPKLEAQIVQLQSDITIATSSKVSAEIALKDVREDEESLADLMKRTSSMSRIFQDLQQMYFSLRSSEKKLQAEAAAAAEATGGASPKAQNLEIITNEYEAIEKLNVTLQRECNTLQEKLESARTEKQLLVEKLNQLKEDANRLARIGDEKERLRKDEAENNAFYANLKTEVIAVRDRLPVVKDQLTRTIQSREEDRQRGTQVEQQYLSQVSSMQRELDQYRSLVNDVDRYEKQLSDRTEMKKDLLGKQEALNSMRQERGRLSKEVQTDQDRAAQNEKIDSDIKANLEYRERERAIVAHQKKIDEKTAYLREISGGELLDDLRSLQSRLVKLKERRSEMRGSMQAEGRMCEDLIAQLTSDRFRLIDSRYKTKLIDVKTHTLANQDLETYHKALDKALMFFHGMKMKEINETLKDYWRTVYKGSDIDEISIVSDGAIVGSRRAYNYRVVMKQGDTELDMRGRCSAGQKVLASLLIRLALADTFCSQCAVLALDEPTTNLDHKNITAFAQALNQIIEKRRDQPNFQLIIITHDETFVDEIGKRSHAEFYYRVYKDNAQHSKIRKQVIEHEEEH